MSDVKRAFAQQAAGDARRATRNCSTRPRRELCDDILLGHGGRTHSPLFRAARRAAPPAPGQRASNEQSVALSDPAATAPAALSHSDIGSPVLFGGRLGAGRGTTSGG